MLISVYNKMGSDIFGPEIGFANLERDMHNPIFEGRVNYSQEPSTKFTMIINEAIVGQPQNITNAIYFIHKKEDGAVEFFARCTYNTKVHLCVAYAASTDVPGVEVQYNLHLEDIDDWDRIQATVLGFVQRLIVGVFDYDTKKP